MVLIGADQGMMPMLLLSASLRTRTDAPWQQLVLLQCDTTFPFRTRPSTIMVDGMPAGVIAAASLLDEQGIASRLCSRADLPGCHDGVATDLAAAWLGTLNQDALKAVELFACGSAALLAAAAKLANDFGVAYQSQATQS